MRFAYVLQARTPSRGSRHFFSAPTLFRSATSLRARSLPEALLRLTQRSAGWSGQYKRSANPLHRVQSGVTANGVLTRDTVFMILSDGWETGTTQNRCLHGTRCAQRRAGGFSKNTLVESAPGAPRTHQPLIPAGWPPYCPMWMCVCSGAQSGRSLLALERAPVELRRSFHVRSIPEQRRPRCSRAANRLPSRRWCTFSSLFPGKSGDKAIISADGAIWGWIGGGCAAAIE